MGSLTSKEEEEEEAPSRVFNTDFIYYDTDGNIRYGSSLRDRDAELEAVLSADNDEEEEGKRWYLVDATWVKTWLAFAHYNKVSPAPGPIDNHILLEVDREKKAFVPKKGLRPASRNFEGHYRRVNKEVWDVYCEHYPGSGPAICVDGEPYDDESRWQVAQDGIEDVLAKLQAEDAAKKPKWRAREESKSQAQDANDGAAGEGDGGDGVTDDQAAMFGGDEKRGEDDDDSDDEALAHKGSAAEGYAEAKSVTSPIASAARHGVNADSKNTGSGSGAGSSSSNSAAAADPNAPPPAAPRRKSKHDAMEDNTVTDQQRQDAQAFLGGSGARPPSGGTGATLAKEGDYAVAPAATGTGPQATTATAERQQSKRKSKAESWLFGES